jgi:hypothetical protein
LGRTVPSPQFRAVSIAIFTFSRAKRGEEAGDPFASLVFLVMRGALGRLGLGPKPDQKDVEIAVLRHQLAVLRRQVPRPRYSPADRVLLATLAHLPSRWSSFLVTPSTLLRWHRQLVGA